MKEYHVVWEVDLSASDAQEAARLAQQMQQFPTTATVFRVFSHKDGDIPQVQQEEVVDLVFVNQSVDGK